MQKILSRNKWFLIPYIFFIIFSSILLIVYSKGDIHLFINRYHNLLLDWFFYFITYLGDGIFALGITFIFLFINFKKSFIIGTSTIFAGLVVQFLKRIIFPGEHRPILFFGGHEELYVFDLVESLRYFSFPSGHTAIGFCIFFSLSYFANKNWIKILFFLAAFLVGYSRMYLSQHFLVDVVFGSLIGVVASLLFNYFFREYKRETSLTMLIKKRLNSHA